MKDGTQQTYLHGIITVERSGAYFIAFLTGVRDDKAFGKTIEAAIGRLIMQWEAEGRDDVIQLLDDAVMEED